MGRLPVTAANFANRTLFHSDNLSILQGMNSGATASK